MCSALVLGHGLKNEIYSCSAQVAKLPPGEDLWKVFLNDIKKIYKFE